MKIKKNSVQIVHIFACLVVIKKISYERCDYESVDEKSLYVLGYVPKNDQKKKEFHP